MDVKRHICILCKRKKTANKMLKTRSHWTCLSYTAPESSDLTFPSSKGLRILNLYAGIGGNRKFWTGGHVTAVEQNVNVAAAYKQLYPEDTLIVGDAHSYLLKNYMNFDIIWSSPPCQTHGRMNYTKLNGRLKYPDMQLYQEIIILRQFFKGKYVIENVVPYYEALIPPTTRLSRHCFWSNVAIRYIDIPTIPGFIKLYGPQDKKKIQDWLDIYYEKNIYLSAHNYIQVFRNCVHPDIGLSIYQDILRSLQQ